MILNFDFQLNCKIGFKWVLDGSGGSIVVAVAAVFYFDINSLKVDATKSQFELILKS